MKKLTSLLIFVGLAFNVSGQDQPKNLKDVFKADWLIGTWERKNDEGQVFSVTYGWKIQDVLMFKESKGSDGKVQSFVTIWLDVDEDKVLFQHYANKRSPTSRRRAIAGEIKVDGDKVIKTDNWKVQKLSKERIESRVESIVANQLASGEVQEAGVPELKQGIRNYFERTSGTNKHTYEKQGEDKMVATSARKDESGQFVAIPNLAPRTYTRKKE
jgi:hypothetical protein